MTKFRHRVRKAGLGELHLNAVVWGISVLPTETKVKNAGELVKMLGFDSGTSYVWVHHFDANAAGFPQAPYSAALAANETAWAKYARELPIPYHPNVSMGWDSSPRTTQTSAFENRGYPWMSTFVGNTPEAFEDALRRAKSFAEKLPPEVRMITINAWNEWTEGSYLLPDTVTGTKYLEAIKRVFAPR